MTDPTDSGRGPISEILAKFSERADALSGEFLPNVCRDGDELRCSYDPAELASFIEAARRTSTTDTGGAVDG